MSISFDRGSNLGPEDLFIIIRDGFGEFLDPISLDFEIFYEGCDPEPMPMITGPTVKVSTGRYYASVVIPADAPLGTYFIRWNLKANEETNRYAIENRFNVKKLKRC